MNEIGGSGLFFGWIKLKCRGVCDNQAGVALGGWCWRGSIGYWCHDEREALGAKAEGSC